MNKALLISAAVSLALSGAAFAGGWSKASASTAISAEQTFTDSDCQMLTVDSARSACMQSAQRSGGGSDAGVGMTSGRSAMGETEGGTIDAKKRKGKRKKNTSNSDDSPYREEQR